MRCNFKCYEKKKKSNSRFLKEKYYYILKLRFRVLQQIDLQEPEGLGVDDVEAAASVHEDLGKPDCR
jgi:hypothetical protein